MHAAGAALVFCVGLAVLVLVSVGVLLAVRARPFSEFEARLIAVEQEQALLQANFKRLLNQKAGRTAAKEAAERDKAEDAPEETPAGDSDEAALQRAIARRFSRNGG
jgi:hypothetical protein